MKNLGKFVKWFIVGFIIVIDILLTVYLLNYNQYNVAVFGDKSILIMNKNIENYKKGDLLVVKQTDNKKIRTGDYIFFYDTSSKENLVNYGRVAMVNSNKNKQNTYLMDNKYILGYESVIGSYNDVEIYPGWGSIVGTLSSKWIFLLVIIMPILVLFLYQLYIFMLELKRVKK